MTTRQQLEQQLVAAHRSGNVQAAQQAAYAIRQYDQNALYAQVPSVNAPPPIDRVPKPTFGDYLGDLSYGLGKGFTSQLEGVETLIQHPIESGKALIQAGVEAVRNPAKAIGEAWSGIKSQAQTAMSSPQGFGQVLGENIDFIPGPGGKRRPTQAELDVYHGTPHTFEPEEGAPLGRFRSEKIGTGEGAQAYGYGLYLAESPDVAEDYAKVLASPRNRVMDRQGVYIEPSPMGDGTYRLGKMSETGKMRGTIGDAIQGITDFKYPNIAAAIRDAKKLGYLPKKGKPLLNAIGEDGKYVPVRRASDVTEEKFGYGPEYAQFIASEPGRVYKVDLPDAKIEQMLDWDKRLSEQPKIVRDAFAKAFSNPEIADDELMAWYRDNPNPTGNALYSQLMTSDRFTGHGQKEASRVLSELGIPGIKYLDAGSRKGEKGTRNFVVFPGEEQHLTILERDGVKAEVPKPDELAYHGTTKQAAAAIEREGFDLTRAADGTVWFTSNPNIGEVAATGKGGIVARSVSGLKLGGWDEMDKYSTDELIAMGYDGLRLKDGDEITYQIFNPEKLKVPTKKAK